MTATKENARIRELKSALQVEADNITRIQNGMKDETGKGHFVLSKEMHSDYLKSVDRATEIQAMIRTEEKAAGILAYLAEPASAPVAGMIAAERARGMERKSLSDAFFESDAYQRMKADDFRDPRGTIKIDQGIYSFEQKDLFTLSGGTHTTPAFGTAENMGIAERMRRPNRVREQRRHGAGAACGRWRRPAHGRPDRHVGPSEEVADPVRAVHPADQRNRTL